MGVAKFLQIDSIIIADGSIIFRDNLSPQLVLFWNITGLITGETPGIQFTLSEVDPSDEITANGQIISSDIITSTGTGVLKLNLIDSPTILISWTVSGETPSFSGVNLSIVSKSIIDKITTKNIAQKQLYDIQSTIIYIGTAQQGSDTGDPVWIIKKITLDINGTPISTLFTDETAIWDNRASETYL